MKAENQISALRELPFVRAKEDACEENKMEQNLPDGSVCHADGLYRVL